ncbi:MAG: hypothetical protein AAB949_00925 [Patescibacteria group bacterium]|mgnify:CR=1 FL=1
MGNNQINQNNSSQGDLSEDVKAVAAVDGAKFGFLVASLPSYGDCSALSVRGLPVEDDVKEALLALAEKLSSTELDALVSALEVAYLDAQTQVVDMDFKSKLQQLKSETEQKEKQLNDEFLQKLEDKQLSG